MRYGVQLPSGAQGVPGGRPVRGGGADAAAGILLMAEQSGLDVLALQRTYRCSYAS